MKRTISAFLAIIFTVIFAATMAVSCNRTDAVSTTAGNTADTSASIGTTAAPSTTVNPTTTLPTTSKDPASSTTARTGFVEPEGTPDPIAELDPIFTVPAKRPPNTLRNAEELRRRYPDYLYDYTVFNKYVGKWKVHNIVSEYIKRDDYDQLPIAYIIIQDLLKNPTQDALDYIKQCRENPDCGESELWLMNQYVNIIINRSVSEISYSSKNYSSYGSSPTDLLYLQMYGIEGYENLLKKQLKSVTTYYYDGELYTIYDLNDEKVVSAELLGEMVSKGMLEDYIRTMEKLERGIDVKKLVSAVKTRAGL